MLTRDDLFGYQCRAVDFLKATPRSALWVDLGLGKTVSALTAFADLRASYDAAHMLVAAPLRVAQRVWDDEIAEWSYLNGLTTSHILGTTPKQRWAGLRKPADIHLINRENLPWLEAQFIQGKKQVRRWPWDVVVLDESHAFANQSSQRHQSIYRLTRPHLNAPIQRLWQLTATPMPREYESIWGQVRLLDDGARLGLTETAYLSRWFSTEFVDNYTRKTLLDGAAAEIQALIADLVLTMRAEDYLDLPPVVSNVIRVTLPPPAHAKYREMEREALAEVEKRTITAVNAGVLWGKLLQLANGAVYYDDKRNWVELHKAKIDALLETLESLGAKKSLIAYGFHHDKARIGEALKRTGRKWRFYETQADEDAWNAGDLDVLVMHPGSGGEGTNLHKSGAEDIVWFGLTPNPVHYEQLNGRLFGGHRRIGKKGRIHHIVAAGTKDVECLALLRRKGSTQDDMKAALVALRRAA